MKRSKSRCLERLGVVGLLYCSAAALGAAGSGVPKLDRAIKKANSEWAAAMRKGDAATIAAAYTDDAIFISLDGSCVRGRPEIEKMYRDRFASGGLAVFTAIQSQHTVVDGDFAYESGSAEIGSRKNGKTDLGGGRFLTVWHRQSDGGLERVVPRKNDPPMKRLSRRTKPFIESVIREMTRLGEQVGGVNLAQGLPDFHPPAPVLAALERAAKRPGRHQYSFTWGSSAFRAAVAKKYARFNAMEVDPEREVTVTCGTSEAIVATVFALTEPGDEVVILEPWYENYFPACTLAGVNPRFVPMTEPRFEIDFAKLRVAFSKKTRLILLNTPGNPTGRVLSRVELEEIGRLCRQFGTIAVVDEIYEHIWFEGHPHVSLASLPGMEDRTVTLSGLGKSYAVTGWRIGWAVAAPRLTNLIRKVHDYLTVCAPAPFQDAGLAALSLPGAYYVEMRTKYARKRAMLLGTLSKSGFGFSPPEGAYYVMADVAPLGWKDDWKFLDFLARKVGVIGVPGSSFYVGGGGRTKMRFNFAKRESTLREAARRLDAWDLRSPGRRRRR